MPKSKYVTAATLVTWLVAAGPLSAQDDAPNPLADVTSLACSFPISATAGWEDGEPQARVRKGPVLMFEYVDIDTSVSTARVIGLSTEGNLVVQLHGANLHFLELRTTGSINITTVFSQESRDKKLKAVHARADYLPIDIPGFVNDPEVSQHYGECEITG